jgi:hypothetical protein
MSNETLRNRTDAKLRYARLHIEELRRQPDGRGHDFERAHQEATLAHLFGAYAALFQELNLYLGCNLNPEDVTLGKMRKALKERGKNDPLLTELYQLEKNPNSWLCHAKDMRDHSTHVSHIPLVHYAGGSQDGMTSFINPKKSQELTGDATATLSSFVLQMEKLIKKYRAVCGVA